MYYALEYDYFLKDHLGNIRTVLTEGKDTAVYVATMEPGNQTTEQALFENEYDPALTVSNKPTNFDSDNANTKVAKLNPAAGYSKPTGPGIMLKVMAGDKVQLSTYGYYNTAVQAPGGTNPFTDLLSAITGSVIGTSGGKLTSGLSTNVSNAISPNLTDFLSDRSYNNTRPKAYLNWILLDEQLNYVSAGSNATQIPTVTVGGAKQPLAPGLQTMPKSGYLYVYVSNESPQPVYFDDITIQHFTGPLVSEESYYSFGGSIAALKSNAALKTTNSYKYNAGTELNESFDIDYYETYFRNYDAQIGRFTGVDILSELTLNFSPYVYAANDPIYWNDPTGASLAADPNYYSGTVSPLNDAVVSASTRPRSAGISFGAWNMLLDQVRGSLNFDWGDGSGIGPSRGGGNGGGGNDQEWHWLTKEVLTQLTDKYGKHNFSSNGQKENYIGNNFEDNWNRYAKGISSLINYEPNENVSDQYDGGNDGNPPPSKVRNIIIDAKADVEHVEINDAGVTVKKYLNAAWFEVKATKNNIYLGTRNYQIYSEISHLIKSEPKAVALGIAQYNIVSTYGGDSKIGPGVYNFGAKYGVQVLSIQPAYRIVNGIVQVQFWHETIVGGLRFPLPYSNIMQYHF